MKAPIKKAKTVPASQTLRKTRKAASNNRAYAPQTFANSQESLPRTTRARQYRYDMLKQKRLAANKRRTGTMMDSDKIEDFVYFVATDSDSEDDDLSEDLSKRSNVGIQEISDFADLFGVTNTQKPHTGRRLAFAVGADSPGSVVPGLTANGYYDEGDPTYTCPHCGALMWYGERLNKRVITRNPLFGLCCKQGKVKLPRMRDPPKTLSALMYNGDVNDGRGPYLFKLSGENYHLIGDLMPADDASLAFLQLYIHDTENEVSNRINAFGRTGNATNIDAEIVSRLKKMLDAHNPHVQGFRTASETFKDNPQCEGLKLVLSSGRKGDGRTHNLPTGNEIAGLIPGDFVIGDNSRDIVLHGRTGQLHRISELHPAYLPLQYPLLFPFGEDGFRLGIDIGFVDMRGRKRKNVSMREFFAYRIQTRDDEPPTIPMAGRLFQQFLVDAYTMIETNRLRYIWFNQKNLRCENYERIKKTAELGDRYLNDQGRRIFIPSSFTGGSRYMMQHY
ncbi:unnamed protein product, partial [Arabidopsis halleri]